MKTIKLILASLMLLAASFAQSAALTDYAENKVVDALIRAQAIGTPATWYVALYTTCPTDSTAGTEVTGGSWAHFRNKTGSQFPRAVISRREPGHGYQSCG